jgi:hypothetical protein
MCHQVSVFTSRTPANQAIAGWPEKHLREHIMRGVLMYARRRRDLLHGLSDEQIQCVIEAITRKAESMIQKQLNRNVDGVEPTTWVGAIAIREAIHALDRNADAQEQVPRSSWQQTPPLRLRCLELAT